MLQAYELFHLSLRIQLCHRGSLGIETHLPVVSLRVVRNPRSLLNVPLGLVVHPLPLPIDCLDPYVFILEL